VDATKGIQAQTISNFYHAFDAGLQIIPVINKIDLQAADVPEAEQQLVDQLDFELEDILYISAKNGINLQSVFDAIIDRINPPQISDTDKLLKCFLFDARHIPSKGVACFVKVMTGVSLDIATVSRMLSFHN